MAEPSAMGLNDLLRQVRTALMQSGTEDAAREARRLICALTKIAPETFLARPEMPVSSVQCKYVMEGLEKRLQGMPIGRIVGARAFYGRSFRLGPAILEPRSDSEVLVDATLEIIHQEGLEAAPLRIVDVGTGSGCLLITLLAELPNATGTGVDIAPDALAVAAKNAQLLGVADRAAFVEGDALANLQGTFDILVSNPPYICTGELDDLQLEVRCHDPVLALDGGADGLNVYRAIARNVGKVVPDGWMLFEVGAGMASAVCHEIDQFSGNDHSNQWRVWQDFNGHERCVAAKTLNNRSH